MPIRVAMLSLSSLFELNQLGNEAQAVSMTQHVSVLLNECCDLLLGDWSRRSDAANRANPGLMDSSQSGRPQVIIDATCGGGGHTAELLARTSALGLPVQIWAFDRDKRAICAAETRFANEVADGKIRLFHRNFSDQNLDDLLSRHCVMGVLADLGFSSDQMADDSRGLSFQSEGPLDFRLDDSQGLTLAQLLQTASIADIERVLWDYGEERHGARIARAIDAARRVNELPLSSKALAQLISGAIPGGGRYQPIHPATRSFQAFRIWVNDELNQLDRFLNQMLRLLHVGGRLAVISFHSLEDRIVKQRFRLAAPNFSKRDLRADPTLVDAQQFVLVTRKALVPTEGEIQNNIRSRSAKLRALEKM